MAVVRVLAARLTCWNFSCSASRAAASLAAAFFFLLKHSRMSASTVPTSNRIPMANPAIPPALIPPDDSGVLELTLDAVAAARVGEGDERLPVAARRASEVPTVVLGEVMAVGRPVLELESTELLCVGLADWASRGEGDVFVSTGMTELVVVFGFETRVVGVVGDGAAAGALVGAGFSSVAIATPTVEYPPILPWKVALAVT